jgi:hypothetical protein
MPIAISQAAALSKRMVRLLSKSIGPLDGVAAYIVQMIANMVIVPSLGTR